MQALTEDAVASEMAGLRRLLVPPPESDTPSLAAPRGRAAPGVRPSRRRSLAGAAGSRYVFDIHVGACRDRRTRARAPPPAGGAGRRWRSAPCSRLPHPRRAPGEALIAVAANFSRTMAELAARFEAATPPSAARFARLERPPLCADRQRGSLRHPARRRSGVPPPSRSAGVRGAPRAASPTRRGGSRCGARTPGGSERGARCSLPGSSGRSRFPIRTSRPTARRRGRSWKRWGSRSA